MQKKFSRQLAAVALLLQVIACSPNNVHTDKDLAQYFENEGVNGCFGLMNNANGEFTMHNLERFRDSAFQPASTFKIVHSLVGLQTGAISNDSMVINWDGTDRGRQECNANLSMYRAFRLSCPPWYQELARRIGKDTMQRWMDSLSYGNKKISRIDTFWLDNSLKIRPDEQLGLVKRLYFNQLPFFKVNQEIVRKAMLFEDNTQYRLGYKTGWGRTEKGAHLAWIVGWIEENNHPYFFVLNFETPRADADIPAIRMRLLKNILKDQGFLQGKK